MMTMITVQADLMTFFFFFIKLSIFWKEAAEFVQDQVDRLQTTLNIAFKFYITLLNLQVKGKRKIDEVMLIINQ